MEVDITAARLQLEELQSHWQGLQDSKFALQLFLQQDAQDVHIADEQFPQHYLDLTDDSLEQQLQEQIASLSAVVAMAEDQQVALAIIDGEEAQQAASLQLASALDAQEHWDAAVLRPHDAALARMMASCSDDVWQGLENPLDLSERPTEVQTEQQGQFMDVNPSQCTHSSSKPHTATGSYDDHCSGLASSSHQEHLQCGICFELSPAHSMMSATLPAEMASSSKAGGRCNHKFCPGCMQQYVCCELQARKFPVYCPNPECDKGLAAADVAYLLATRPDLLQVYHALEAEQLIELEMRVYCPYKDCSAMLEQPEQQGEAADSQEAPFECPVCHRSFCISCGIAGWHTGMTCAEFQALPAEDRSAEDAAMLSIAREKHWKRCPSCKHIVERSVGCNHMKCRCGSHFCYACGNKYISAEPTANNEHGTQGCTCRLFEVPAEPAAAAAPVVLNQARPRPGRPWRNGRFVSTQRCRHSDSIFTCPHGPGRCWFWHDEDEDSEDERQDEDDGESE